MNKIIIITGTRKGIGKSLVEYYLKKNFTVAGCSRGTSSIFHENYIHHELDVSDEKAVVSFVKSIAREFGTIDILINNAGMASMNHFILTPLRTAHNIFNTNFFGTFLLTREVAKVMMKKKRGRIVNFSSVAVPLFLEGEAIYASSKSAIEALTGITARELGGFGITVNTIGPTPIKTELIKNVPEDKISALLDRQSIKRFGEFDDIINVIDFFIDNKSDFITGQTIYLGGVNGS